jgi:hypothetical protein
MQKFMFKLVFCNIFKFEFYKTVIFKMLIFQPFLHPKP